MLRNCHSETTHIITKTIHAIFLTKSLKHSQDYINITIFVKFNLTRIVNLATILMKKDSCLKSKIYLFICVTVNKHNTMKPFKIKLFSTLKKLVYFCLVFFLFKTNVFYL